ncbi:unnamed protein product [Polarella glacialis]|uniref:Fe2OG dioxygenase domain-containing protein n=1 Tax=Polarella glacialis TaxID=89957 RepID=A0A813LDH5_POLGL|nr:unnamed protein product [Polarella glacialis]CAE8730420.1 unnamed protein product [Polarella glacialis]
MKCGWLGMCAGPWCAVCLLALVFGLLGGLLAALYGPDNEVFITSEAEEVLEDFLRSHRQKAVSAYELLYSDGEGLEGDGGEAPPGRQAFEEQYLLEALKRETERVMQEKGHASHRQGDEKPPLPDIQKKDAPASMDGQVEALLVQKRQRQAIRERVRAGKPLEVGFDTAVQGSHTAVQSLTVPCGEPLYQQHAYSTVPFCSPGAGPSQPCSRWVVDDLTTQAEDAEMMRLMDSSLEGLFHQGSETLLVPDADSRARLGPDGSQLTAELLSRARASVSRALNVSSLFYSGSLLKRMDYPPIQGEMQLDAEHDSVNPHVDKANIASYDWSALLYFNSVGQDFDGGELLFHDLDSDQLVDPVAGRLVFFSSGLENLHRVRPMTRGQRYVLAMWFTCSEVHAHPSLLSSTGQGHAQTYGGSNSKPLDSHSDGNEELGERKPEL